MKYFFGLVQNFLNRKLRANLSLRGVVKKVVNNFTEVLKWRAGKIQELCLVESILKVVVKKKVALNNGR